MRRISGIQYLRALAAFSVLLYHAAHYVATIRHDGALFAVFDGHFGLLGITLFFVISGYLMAGIAGTTPASVFLVHRVFRIYPVYWLVAGAVALAKLWLAEPVALDPAAFMLIPGGPHWYVLGVEWTLPFELVFYVIVFAAIAVGQGRRLHLLALGWLALLVAARVWFPYWEGYSQDGNFPTLTFLPFSERCVGFVLGLMIPAAIARVRAGPGCLVLGLSLILACGAMPAFVVWTVGAGCALLVAVAASAGERPAHGEIETLSRLGDWSFALYLVHVPTVIWLLQALPPACPPLAAWLAAIGASLAVSVLVGKLDIRLYRGLKRGCDRAPGWLRHAANALFLTAILGGGLREDLRVRRERHETREAAAVGAQLADGTDAALPLLQRAARRGLLPGSVLVGHLDLASDLADQRDRVRVSGWVVDRSGNDPAPAVLFFLGGRYVGSVLPATPRPDVLAALRIEGGARIGFAGTLPGSVCAPGAALEALLLSGRQVAPLSIPPDALRCAGPP
ncbi:acyltransferase [Roseomonas sp. NAR14]|uniref:Acyltransferase n=1 Tax=Roseomonas acroporae TaxID=2937791 RepID=A0A9X1YBB7_9PROT|nr:acyltransferase [Roseomonas acroporae]